MLFKALFLGFQHKRAGSHSLTPAVAKSPKLFPMIHHPSIPLVNRLDGEWAMVAANPERTSGAATGEQPY
jgi:hypothetical protein